ncbi:FAD/NAD-P-binding domain-containing protein [Pleurostoma richardsiae]|uniref:FAD/NAD-P-binding domain-containing protein n=1 Tax=Pleurostoma richardsiae TaxID=41990 RepID=A0AA38S7X0_9PEZI|nr:FAD/NAD-P-binding domain-containing protein [Pleurostoma richardsiae]
MSPLIEDDVPTRTIPSIRKVPLVASPAAPELFNWPTTNENGYKIKEEPMGTKRPMKIIVLGAGASGINFLKTAADKLDNIEVVCYEKNADVGGTWLENTYPGVACDIPSVSYQFTWEPHIWPEYYSTGHEILKYLRGIVDKYELMRFIKLNHSVKGADWSEDEGKWHITVEGPGGGAIQDTCDVFLNGGGILNNFRYPNIQGLHDFKGKLMHTARWDNDYDLKGKRVVVIGAGSSAAQVVPSIQPIVKQLHEFIKSPTWITAGFAQRFAGLDGGNFEYTDAQKARLRDDQKSYLEYRKMIESEIGQRFRFLMKGGPEATEARRFSEEEMRRKLKGNTEIANAIIPKNFTVGCRRPTPGEGFLEALVAANVTVHTKQMQQITETGFIAHDGTTHDVDVIICATGFDTSWVPRFPVKAHGKNLQDVWRGKTPLSYLAVGVPEMPNYFMFAGPYGPLAVGSLLPIIEVFTDYIITTISKMQIENIKSVSPKMGPALAFKEHHDLYVNRTAWSDPCSSWFKKGDPNGTLTMYPGSRVHFFELLRSPRYEDYDIKYMSNNQWEYLGNGFHMREFDGRDTTFWMGLLDGEDRQPQYNGNILSAAI